MHRCVAAFVRLLRVPYVGAAVSRLLYVRDICNGNEHAHACDNTIAKLMLRTAFPYVAQQIYVPQRKEKRTLASILSVYSMQVVVVNIDVHANNAYRRTRRPSIPSVRVPHVQAEEKYLYLTYLLIEAQLSRQFQG